MPSSTKADWDCTKPTDKEPESPKLKVLQRNSSFPIPAEPMNSLATSGSGSKM